MDLPSISSFNNSIVNAGDPISGADQHTDDSHILLRPRRPVGRPKGSKSKPRAVPPLESKPLISTAVIEIPTGADVVQSLLQFCHRHQVSITVLTGSGWLSHITLHHRPNFTMTGPFHILSLSGTVAKIPQPGAINSPETCFPLAVLLSGSNGETFGGMVGGRVTAASTVNVVAMKTELNNVTFESIPDGEAKHNNLGIKPTNCLPSRDVQFSEFYKSTTSGGYQNNNGIELYEQKENGTKEQDMNFSRDELNGGDIWSYGDNLNRVFSLAPSHPLLM